jgi:hypothetical protein
MIFQCQDLDRALEFPELMPDALAHAESCQRCREQLDLWDEISRVAPQLHEHWESPDLWPRIRSEIGAAQSSSKPVIAGRWPLALAAAVVLSALLWQTWLWRQRPSPAPNRELLTEETFREVQQAEAAYTRSIEKLSALAGPSLNRSPAPLAAAYREKLVVLDAAIADVKSTARSNRYNAYVQTQLASLYREKQKTLQDWLANAKQN